MKPSRIAAPGRTALACLLLACLFTDAQEQPEQKVKLEITVLDSESGETIPFANVVAYNKEGQQVSVMTTSLDGVGFFEGLTAGEYKIKAVYVGYNAADTLVDLRGKGRFQSIRVRLGSSPGFICCGLCCGCFGSGDGEDVEPLEYGKTKFVEPEEMSEVKDSGVPDDLNDFNCYPNPTRGLVHVSVRGVQATQMALFAPTGQLLHTFDLSEAWELHVDLRRYPAGLYYFVCTGKGKFSSAKKVVKED